MADDAQQALLQEIEDYFAGGIQPAKDASRGDRELRIATAVLLLELCRADYESKHDEHRAVARALEQVLQATPEQTAAIVRLAEEQVKVQRPIHHFTTEIEKSFTRDEKRQLLKGLWRVAFADAELLAHEEYLIRKIAELIQLPFEDFLRAKIEAKEAFFGEG
jgi:uncharacterized tellurite resistance protein B-like protein